MSTLMSPAASESPGIPWPAPHHMRLIDSHGSGAPERALVTLANGDKVLGIARRMDFEQGLIDFQPDQGAARELPFKGIRHISLARPVELEPIPLNAPAGGVAAKVPHKRRTCTVWLNDGHTLEADVVAVLAQERGLFLYIFHYGGDVLRWFVPAEGVRSYRVGDLPARTLADGGEPSPALPPAAAGASAASVGEYLTAAGGQTRLELEEAIRRRKDVQPRQLSDLLVEDRLVTEVQRDAALAKQATDPGRFLGDILVEMGALSRDALLQVLVTQVGVPCVNLTRFQFEPEAVQALPADIARKYTVVPLYRSQRRIAVATEDPLAWKTLRVLEFMTGLKVDPVLAKREELLAVIAQLYSGAKSHDKIDKLVAQLDEEAPLQADPTVDLTVSDSDNTLVRLVNKMILDAFERGASDIHLESRTDNQPSRVRFRIDGALKPYIEVPPRFRAAMISRIKIMAELDISERRRPQDGKIRLDDLGPRRIELRVLVMPTSSGLEDVVMRILAAPRALKLDQLGFSPRDRDALGKIAARSYGLLLVCGPTGSGKTTTLHSLLDHINTPERKIWTVEDPVEITQPGLCQVQVNNKLGLTFPVVLRSFLRADPDVIMVGETRDADTARTVVAASLTGHLVLSTMHTNSAVESVVRLIDLGVDPFNGADALLGVMGQRLVRKLCQCKQPHAATPEELTTLAGEYCAGTALEPQAQVARWQSRYANEHGEVTLYQAAGCRDCDDTGYRGRLGAYELLVVSPAVKAAMQARATSAELLAIAVSEGMTTLVQDGIEKVLQGEFDLRQVQNSCM